LDFLARRGWTDCHVLQLNIRQLNILFTPTEKIDDKSQELKKEFDSLGCMEVTNLDIVIIIFFLSVLDFYFIMSQSLVRTFLSSIRRILSTE